MRLGQKVQAIGVVFLAVSNSLSEKLAGQKDEGYSMHSFG
jgi:hypothetical protein